MEDLVYLSKKHITYPVFYGEKWKVFNREVNMLQSTFSTMDLSLKMQKVRTGSRKETQKVTEIVLIDESLKKVRKAKWD